ncbi:PadR family transcriptional regulator [Streptomyces beijiangensis]|uniref:PadR family transcriptional regulator n=1 Tax=Streptomyces beijiangensis TaxID=163361 RepID=A0A939JM31_9ACTN|nr:PadR family transcriptional regulator [Streptomyces beijiangensis]MBO0517010.1 PadR family transcriptional regulator [Streptomyces beijiangensis]
MNATPPRSSPLALTVLALLHYKPLHPYGIQRLIKDWGKEQVVNVSQRASLYRTIERLHGAGLIEILETGRDQLYPERTVYEVTDAGRDTARAWLEEMLGAPKAEFPEFPAALSNLLLLSPEEMADTLDRRATALAEKLDGIESGLLEEKAQGLPRVTRLETEYLRAVTDAELEWVRAVVKDLRAGRITWTPEVLDAFAEGAGEQ